MDQASPVTRIDDAPSPAPTVREVSVIMNEGSGSSEKSQLREQIEQAFDGLGVRVHVLPIQAAGGIERVGRLVERAEGRLAVAGGDGTINAVASACRKLDRPLGLLPAGTFNYVARNLELPTTVPEAVEVIVHGKPTPIGAGDINGHLFLNNAGIGLYSEIIEQREHDKNRFGRKQIVALYSGLRLLVRRHPMYGVRLDVDGNEVVLRTTAIFFGVNALQLANYNVQAAEQVKQGALAVLSLRAKNRLDIAEAAWASFKGKTEDANSVNAASAQEVHVTSHRRHAFKVAIDGEVIHLRSPLHVRYVPDALKIILPEKLEKAATSESQS